LPRHNFLKADLHLHTSEDPREKLKYSAKETIKYASKLGFRVLSITNHNVLTYNKKLALYAKKNGILLIPGIELKIEGKDVLLYNIKKEEIKKIKTLADLRNLRRDILVIAPHPFYKRPQCLGERVIEYRDCFDALEHSHFYFKFFNFNRRAEKVAERYRFPLVSFSDAHYLWQIGLTYSLIQARPQIESVFTAIKENRVKLITQPLSFLNFLKVCFFIGLSFFKKRFKRRGRNGS
jgi:hypothetical protein